MTNTPEGGATTTTNWWAYGPDSPNYLTRFGGPQRVAELLQEMGYGTGRPVTRQAAYSLWKHRRGNGFPDRVRVQVPGAWRQLFDLEEVRAWAQARIDAGEVDEAAFDPEPRSR